MAITKDWHIHTHCSCDSACMTFEDLVSEAKELGITDFGVSDHYHTTIQGADIAASRMEYEETLLRHPELKGHFHFGMEATLVSKWEAEKIARGEYDELPVYGFRSGGPKNAEVCFDFDEEFMEKYKIEYVIAGMHWPMYCDIDTESVVKEYHRQYMYAATYPFTDILAHYMWCDVHLFTNVWNIKDFKNPLADFNVIPFSMKDELKAALKENNVAFELNNWLFNDNLGERFIASYLDWVSELQSSGIKIAFGSDNHSPNLKDLCDYKKIDQACRKHGIKSDEFYCV